MLYRPDENMLPVILNNLGEDYDSRVLPSIIGEEVKSIISKYAAEQLITQREKVSIDIREGLTRRVAEFSIILDDVSITDMQFSREYVQSVEAKQVAQQVAEMKKFKVQKEQELAKANAIRSQGSAESARLVNEAIEKAGRGMITLRKI